MKNALSDALHKIITALDYPETNIVVQLPRKSEHGDFTTNLALQLGGELDENPQVIAQTLAEKLLEGYPQLVESTHTAGPGFLNITINKGKGAGTLPDICLPCTSKLVTICIG